MYTMQRCDRGGSLEGNLEGEGEGQAGVRDGKYFSRDEQLRERLFEVWPRRELELGRVLEVEVLAVEREGRAADLAGFNFNQRNSSARKDMNVQVLLF